MKRLRALMIRVAGIFTAGPRREFAEELESHFAAAHRRQPSLRYDAGAGSTGSDHQAGRSGIDPPVL